MNMNWNNVTESLPDDCLTVIVAGVGENEPIWLGYYEAGIWYTVEGDVCCPSHWMDLPEVPEKYTESVVGG